MDAGNFGRGSDWRDGSPYMVVNAGETLYEATKRHRRETGHIGVLVVVAFSGRGRTPGCRRMARLGVAVATATAA
jgi:hypothetical protein